MIEAWGILKPSDISSARRLQSLGLTRAIRHFNEKAVPGMGGIWFAMPLIWSMLGIMAARKLDRRPIEVANAVEALAMKLALENDDAQNGRRIKGARNLPRAGWTFEELRKQGAYVTQPFRQSCTQPLLTLGLVEGTSARFNSFRLTTDGERLLAPLAVVHVEIERWIAGGKGHDRDVLAAMLPTAALPDAICSELIRRIYGIGVDAERRKTIRNVGKKLTSDGVLDRSMGGIFRDHLIDLRSGIALVRLRSAAIQVLGAVESRIAKLRDNGQTPELTLVEAIQDDVIGTRIDACITEAERAAPHIEAAGEVESCAFLSDCKNAGGLLQRLARRDGVVIVLRDDMLVRGPAFGAESVLDDDRIALVSGVPELPRISNLLALTDDLAGSNVPAVVGKVAG